MPIKRIRGRTGIFTGLSLRQLGDLSYEYELTHPAQKVKAHSFASPSFDGYALSRKKGVAIQA